ncbi:MAG: type I-A CRISPR-associated protein Cas7/Csa2 [Acidilobaceae archaeon]|nr:type I-A CRISPR-associated protein Cas7/Csa2 [Acidilobaceae archaeon]
MVAVALRPSDRIVLSLSARVLVNVEALNMAETVGNVSRHRKAPVVVPSEQGPSLVYVPAVSGESIAHHFQKIFVSIAKERGLPVPKLEEQGYFLKYASEEVLKSHYPEIEAELAKVSGICEAEKVLVGRSAVADVAGFLFAGDKKPSVKRSSRVHFSYLIPALDSVARGAVAAHSQIHVRYSPEARRGEQALYYVEGASALYTLSVVFAASDVGKLEYCQDKSSLDVEERKKRVDAALDALLVLLDGMRFGAKHARYLPHWKFDSIVAAVSVGPVDFVVSPASNSRYIQETVERANSIRRALGNRVDVQSFVYVASDSSVKPPQQAPGVTVYNAHTEVLEAAAAAVRKLMGIAPQAPRK